MYEALLNILIMYKTMYVLGIIKYYVILSLCRCHGNQQLHIFIM